MSDNDFLRLAATLGFEVEITKHIESIDATVYGSAKKSWLAGASYQLRASGLRGTIELKGDDVWALQARALKEMMEW